MFPVAPEDWHIFSFGGPTPSSGDVTSTDVDLEQVIVDAAPQPTPAPATVIASTHLVPTTTPEEAGIDPCAVTTTTSPLPVDPAPTTTTASLFSTAPLQSNAATAKTTTTSHPLDSSPGNSHLAPPVDQGIPDLGATNHHVPPCGINILTTINDLPADARVAGWTRSKKTLEYFRGVREMGNLSDLVLHWYQLEEVLGFPETVSTQTI